MSDIAKIFDNEALTPGVSFVHGVDHYVQNFGDKMDKLFGIGPKAAPAPEAVGEPPPVMPTPDDEMMQLAKKRSLTEMMRRRGRASTILTDPLGG